MNIQQSPSLSTLWIKTAYTLLTLCIIIRLFYLQIYLGAGYATQSKKNYLRYEHIPAPRGQILDCRGRPLVTNIPVRNLYWQSSGKKQLTEQQKQTIVQLTHLCPINYNEALIQQISMAERRNSTLLLYPNLNFNQLSAIEELFADDQNISIRTDFKRDYLYKKTASHLMGYLSNIDINTIGKMGLEKAVDKKLQGIDGALIKTINSYGKEICSEKIKESVPGFDIHTTIDIALQQIAEAAFSDEYIGTCIIMNPETGAIKALLSRPNFDPNIFLEPIYYQQWQTLQEHQPFLNRAINCSYPPGSLFKLVTISAALETGLINSYDLHTCNGYIHYGNRDYWCNKHQGHGTISIKQGLALSCNTLFYELGKKLSINVLADYAKRFGLGQKTGFLLNEATGLIPTTEWKRETKGQPWWPGETLSASIGQSYLLTTPLQIARMFSAIFTNYLTKPRILEDEPIERVPLAIKQETLEFLKESMRSVVTEGTGRRVNKINNIEVYAKTSTAQTSTIDKRNFGRQYFEHGWVVVHFTIKGQQPLTLVVLVEHAGTSRVPVMIAKQLLLQCRNFYEKERA